MSRLCDLENDLSGLAGLDHANRLVRCLERKPVRDDGRRIELARAKKAGHRQPRVVHAPADDAVDREPFEDDLGREVDVHRLRRNAEHLHAAAHAHERECLVNRRRNARHLEHDVHAESVGVPLHDGLGFVRMHDVVARPSLAPARAACR